MLVEAAYAGADTEDPMEWKLGTYDVPNYIMRAQIPMLTGVAKVDKIEINGVIVNRGQCDGYKIAPGESLASYTQLPATRKFGEELLIFFFKPCHVLELKVDTDQGDFTYTW